MSDGNHVDGNGMRIAKMVCVSVDDGSTANSNKFYNMIENGDGTFTVEYGRVGRVGTKRSYPMSRWDATYKKRMRKSRGTPYKDVTHLHVENGNGNGNGNGSANNDTKDTKVKKDTSSGGKFLEMLNQFARKSIKRNFVVSSDVVTQSMVDEAQGVLSTIVGQIKPGADVRNINGQLMELFSVIPRSMDNVKMYLLGYKSVKDTAISFDTLRKKNMIFAQSLLSNEQDVLDQMAGQVGIQVTTKTSDNRNLADIMGLTLKPATQAEMKNIRKMMRHDSNEFRQAFRITNRKTEPMFKKMLPTLRKKKTELFWHGSRNENWTSILQSGLLIRPSGAVYTGSMFGDGIYFADKYRKSAGYTSLSGSYWASGSSNKAFIALFEAGVGKQKTVHHSAYDLSWSKINRQGYDSVFAKGGADLRNNEYIVYRPEQCTVRFLVEIAN